MTIRVDARKARPFVEASLCYVVDTGEKPVIYPSEAGGRAERRTGKNQHRKVSIANGYAAHTGFSLESTGFVFTRHDTAVCDFYDEEEVVSVYDAEVASLVKSLAGAADVMVIDHTRRAGAAATRTERRVREPAIMVHNDYTPRSGPQRVRDLLPEHEAERRLERRVAIINVWRPIRGPVETFPLALCDATSVARSDLVVTERRARERTGEIYQLAYSPDHRWFYFPFIERDEALVFVCYDSEKEGLSGFAPHTAFDDPTSAPGAPQRESIESRCLAFF